MKKSAFYLRTVKIRTDWLLKQFGEDFWRGKSILELGPFSGEFGQFFYDHGAEVTCAEKRDEYIGIIKSEKPNLKIIKCNLETEFPDGHWDVITHMRILHHLLDPEKSLKTMVERGNFFLIEARVLDSDDPHLTKVTSSKKSSGTDKRKWVTAAWIERVLQENGVKFKRHDSDELSSRKRWFNWPVKNTGEFLHGCARFWTAWK